MAEKLKELLEKINQEGIKQAEEKARAIESKARKDAEKLIEDAKTQAQRMVQEAKSEAEKMAKIKELALRQAARDLLLALKDEVRKILDKVIAAETAKSMSHEDMVTILGNLIERYIETNAASSNIEVLLKKEDLGKLKDTFIVKMKNKLKDGIEFKPSPNINAGFSISFDKGKSFFDFTDEGLAEALSAYLSPEISKLLK